MTKHILPYLFILLGAVVLGNAVIATVLSNLSTGIWMTYLLGALLMLGGILFHRLPSWVIIIGGIALLVLAFCIVALFVYGNTDTVTYEEDAVIVLGASIKGDKPTKSLQNRLDVAVTYHAQNPNAVIIVSGGKGSQEAVTEAYAMEQYLIKKGVPASCILKEEAATSTTENFMYAKSLIEARFDEACQAAFITTDYHIYRAAQNATRAGFQNIVHAHSGTPWYMILPSGLRECLAICKYWIFG